jgi:hypothetical protein
MLRTYKKPLGYDPRDLFMRDPATGKRIVHHRGHRVGLADSLEEAIAMRDAYVADIASGRIPEPPAPPPLDPREYWAKLAGVELPVGSNSIRTSGSVAQADSMPTVLEVHLSLRTKRRYWPDLWRDGWSRAKEAEMEEFRARLAKNKAP